MPNSEITRLFKTELKENLILRHKYYHNTSPNIDNEINYIIPKLYLTYLSHYKKILSTNCNISHSL